MIAPILHTERLTLRLPGPQDVEAHARFLASDRARFVGGPMQAGAAWRALATMIGHWTLRGFGMWTVTLVGSDRALGLVGHYFPNDWPEREVGWHLWDSSAEGKGYAFEAAMAARNHAFDALGWTTAVSYINPENRRSIALAERLGATRDALAPTPNNDPLLVYRHPRAA